MTPIRLAVAAMLVAGPALAQPIIIPLGKQQQPDPVPAPSPVPVAPPQAGPSDPPPPAPAPAQPDPDQPANPATQTTPK